MGKENVVVLNLDDEDLLFEQLSSLEPTVVDKLKHLLWVTEMERDHCKKKQRSYFNEFKEIYMGDYFIEGDVVNNIQEEIDGLSQKTDEGSLERLFYLKRWLEHKFDK
jgi:hypothetical protein